MQFRWLKLTKTIYQTFTLKSPLWFDGLHLNFQGEEYWKIVENGRTHHEFTNFLSQTDDNRLPVIVLRDQNFNLFEYFEYQASAAEIEEIKVLIVDDHPMIIEGYKNALLGINSDEMTLQIDTADSCDDAYSKIKNAATGTPYDVVFLDIKLPPSAD